jgi:hypothetical protein
MLELDDAALTRLCIAAGAIPQEGREEWLQTVAHRLEQPRSSPAAERQRRRRERQRQGRIVLSIEANKDDLADALEAVGFLKGWDREDTESIEAAVTELLDVLTSHA